jgi:hypothetical protein
MTGGQRIYRMEKGDKILGKEVMGTFSVEMFWR